ncbi:hypothetical protein FIBSPDRAFT_937399 [Athelia psychrophila]|uniref:Uncharacterized protein n=1 Tax=Athelia psychrophila TaxID=1759441 RepID=A0A166AK91_9AGAM|nr:hypothetical protein FIBSPDRAFT_937399 [Fibularhizoctonia sp. CBS 109695]
MPPYKFIRFEAPVTQQGGHEGLDILAEVASRVAKEDDELASATTSDALHQRHPCRWDDGLCTHVFTVDIHTTPDFTPGVVAEHLRTAHDMGDSELLFCQWEDCGLAVHSPQTVARHIMWGHMEVGLQCFTCNEMNFGLEGLEQHRAACK